MWPISRSFSYNLFYVVASRFLRDPIFLPSFSLRSALSFDFPFPHPLVSSISSTIPPLILILFPHLPNSLFYFPFSVKCTARHFFRVSEFTPLTLYPPSFYLFMHSQVPLFLSTSVSRTFSPSFRNFIRLHMVSSVEFSASLQIPFRGTFFLFLYFLCVSTQNFWYII